MTIKKGFLTLLTTLCLLCLNISVNAGETVRATAGITGDSCTIGGLLFGQTVVESNKSLNLSTAFMSTSKVSFNYTTAWSGTMSCLYGGAGIGSLLQDHVYYFSALNSNPVYMNFTSTDGDSDYWIKVSIAITGNTKTTVSGVSGYHGISSYQTSYTLNAELLSAAPSGVSNYTKTSTSSVISVVPVVASGSGNGSSTYGGLLGNKYTYADEVWEHMMNDSSRASWSNSRYLAYERLYIQFEPNKTTCNLKKDITVQLPPASVSVLQRDGQAPGTNFTLPVTCSDALGGTTSSRDIVAWLSSNDILNDADTGTILVNPETDASGVGISLRPYYLGVTERDIVIASGTGKQTATELFSISKGDYVDNVIYIYLNAYYRVHDRSAISAGKVVATAQLMLSYD